MSKGKRTAILFVDGKCFASTNDRILINQWKARIAASGTEAIILNDTDDNGRPQFSIKIPYNVARYGIIRMIPNCNREMPLEMQNLEKLLQIPDLATDEQSIVGSMEQCVSQKIK